MKNNPKSTASLPKRLFKNTSFVLLLIVVMASAVMIVMNFYTIRILSAARAYINGESQYSKGQKDASAHLIKYIFLQNKDDYIAFERDISVPEGDRIARVALSANNDHQLAKKGFLQGKNHLKDVDDLIWLFSNFQHLPMFEKVIGIWASADVMVSKLHQVGIQSRYKVNQGKISIAEKGALILSISDISTELTIKEQAFSDELGAICRSINLYIFMANVLITLVILTSSLSYAGIMIGKLANSQKKVVEQNEDLQVINAGLDKFVFNVTHDLRSPLMALIGLIALIDEERDPVQIKSYTLMMKESLEKQDHFIKEMLIFIKSKHSGLIKEECSLTSIIDTIIAQNYYRNGGKAVHIYKEMELNKIDSDALKLHVILNNLVSNSIKYSDSKKEEQWVKIKTYRHGTTAIIEVEDNGLGIRENDQQRIFDKFYMSGNNKHSSGMGLYLVKDAVTQMNGHVEVKSEPGLYSKFTISIPF
ncbi:HAMP domain-containing sensor histidine kinase [Mucilaginibacter sp.]|uniref:sensor histidine kinase n=1 Tax=Mucilaginibacter sp. TaxID=1882438 RepID=UPI00262DD1D6|nr:HAMP domain-containing sensor histidine kinase [Mucilaginibacter sp.]MDB4922151.1 His Kinase (phospho-acceptor) protein [Mucilaginibacter sp.]